MKFLRIILVLIFLFLGISYITFRGINRELKNRNFIENLAVDASQLPSILKTWIRVNFRKPEQAIEIERTDDLYKIGKFPEKSSINNSIYLLYYKYLSGEKGKVYLQNIKEGDIAFSWDIPLSKIMDDLKSIDKRLKDEYHNGSLPINLSTRVKKNLRSIQISAPIISKDSSLIFHCGTLGYLYKIDRNSKLLWKSKRLVHHSIEVDSLNNIWTCSIDLKNKTANYYGYREDAILCLSPDGNEKHFFSLTKIFKSNNFYKTLIMSSPNHELEFGLDPYHLNDVLPLNKAGEFWEKGDLLLSLRHQSMIILYRPISDSIIWQQQGPWLGQHDINIVNDSVISVFNNNKSFFKKNEPKSTSNIAFFNLTDKKTIFRYNNIFNSPFQGRQVQIENKGLIIEETGKAKYYILDSHGTVSGKFYIPYFSDTTRAMNPTWARVYLQEKDKYKLQ